MTIDAGSLEHADAIPAANTDFRGDVEISSTGDEIERVPQQMSDSAARNL